MNESKTPLPDWVATSKADNTQYINLMGALQNRGVDKLFKFTNLLFYVFIGSILSEYVWDRNMLGAFLILGSVTGITIGTLLIFSKLGKQGFTFRQLLSLFVMLPRLSKLFVFGSVIFIIVLSSGTVFTILSPESISFIDLMYTSLPVAVAIFNITMVYPLTLLRKHSKKQQMSGKQKLESDDSELDIETVHESGNVEFAEIDEDPKDMSSGELLEKMAGNSKRAIMEQVASAKKFPMALRPEEIDTLSDHDCLEEYVREHS